MEKNQLLDIRAVEKPTEVVATPPGVVLRFTSADQPPKVIYVPVIGEQPELPEFKPRESISGASWFKSLID